MKFVPVMAVCVALLSGCAENFLNKAESLHTLDKVSANQTHHDVNSLAGASRKASKMAYAYVQAARRVTTVQDAASAIVILSAGATAYGVATDVSGGAIADRALPGIVAGLSGRRYASSETVKAIYSGAQRLNCIAAKAGIAASLGEITGDELENAAVAATRSAMLDAQILTRADVVRENAEFKDLFDEIKGNLEGVTTGANRKNADLNPLTHYISELNSCLSKSIETSEPNRSTGEVNNPDIPDGESGEDEIVQN